LNFQTPLMRGTKLRREGTVNFFAGNCGRRYAVQ